MGAVEYPGSAVRRHGVPEIFTSDQGSQFTSEAFTGLLRNHGIQISMDGKGRCVDKGLVEGLWRSLKYEEVNWKGYATVAEAKKSLRGIWTSSTKSAGTSPWSDAHPMRCITNPLTKGTRLKSEMQLTGCPKGTFLIPACVVRPIELEETG